MKSLKSLENIFNKYAHYFLYLIVMVSPFLDYRLIPWNPQLNYIRIGLIVLLTIFYISKFNSLSKLKCDTLFKILLGYSLYKLASSLWSIDYIDALLSSIFWASISLLYLFFANFNLSKQKIKDIESVIIITGIFNSIVAITQGALFYFFQIKAFNIYGWDWPWGFRVTGLSYDANHLAAFLILPMFLAIDKALIKKSFKRFLYLIPVIIFLVTLYFSASRSGLLAIFFGLFIYGLIKTLGNKIIKLTNLLALTTVLSALFAVFLLYTPLSQSTETAEFNKWNSIINQSAQKFLIHGRGIDNSALAHFALIYNSFYLQSSNYYLGVGAGNFAEGIKKNTYTSEIYRRVDPDVLSKPDFPAHSMYAEALGEGGYIALILFITIVFKLANRHAVNKNLPYYAFIVSIAIFMIFYSLNEEFFWLFAFIGLLKNNTVRN